MITISVDSNPTSRTILNWFIDVWILYSIRKVIVVIFPLVVYCARVP